MHCELAMTTQAEGTLSVRINSEPAMVIPEGSLGEHLRKSFAPWMEDGDRISGWKTSAGRCYGVSSYGEIQDFPQALVSK